MTDATTTPTDKAEPVLLPCPFCGGEAWLNDYEAKHSDLPPQSRAPQCRSCGASPGYLPTAKKAIAAWNTRTHPQTSLSVGLDREAVARVIHPWAFAYDQHKGMTEKVQAEEYRQGALAKADKIIAAMARSGDTEAALRDARDFIDRYSDMRDGDYGAQEPNEAMQLVHAIDQVLPAAPTGGRK